MVRPADPDPATTSPHTSQGHNPTPVVAPTLEDRLGQHIRDGVVYNTNITEKYVVNPKDAGHSEWDYEEFQRLSDYLWTLTDKLDAMALRIKTLEHPHTHP